PPYRRSMQGFRPFFRGLARAALVAATALPVGAAHADDRDPPVVTPGRQDAPPGPSPAAPAPLPMSDSGRRAVRGCDVGESCDHLLAGLRAFEREAFPRRRGASPWGDGERITASRAPGARSPRRRPASPTELRPDLPWLAGLEMPDLPVHWDHRIIRFLEFYVEDPRGQQLMRA